MPGNMGNSNFCFWRGAVFGSIAAVDDKQGAGVGNPIVQIIYVDFYPDYFIIFLYYKLGGLSCESFGFSD